MTVKAYLVCKVSSGNEREACAKIAEFVNVLEANIIYGEYDLVVKLQVKDLEQLDFVTEEIRRFIPSIILTSTMIVAREYKGKTDRNPKILETIKN